MILPSKYRQGKRLQTLVENQTTYTLPDAEMHIFETHTQAADVLLRFDHPVLASMISGKKIMHIAQQDPFAFLPGESVLLSANEWMGIDFPEATTKNPTKCLAMTLSEEWIQQVVDFSNAMSPKVDDGEWLFLGQGFQFCNDAVIHQLIQRLIFLIVEDHTSKDVFIDMMLRELLIRILQEDSKNYFIQNAKKDQTHNRIAFIINYIRENIREKLTIKDLSKKAYMSESNFYKVFKNELGCSPVDFINEERIRLASTLLQNPDNKVRKVSMECGFNSLSYFNRVFKKKHSLSPKAYQDYVNQE
jgi:AraC family transcriptional regulator